MKKILIVSAFIVSCISISAQPPQGGPGGGRPPMEGEMPRNGNNDTSIGIMKMPEIPGLTIKQREKLSKTLTDEQKTIGKLMDEKHELMKPNEHSSVTPTEKEIEKQTNKVINIDKKIEKAKNKSDKKIRSILTSEQYDFFVTKRDDIEFRRPKHMGRDKHPIREGENWQKNDRREPPKSLND